MKRSRVTRSRALEAKSEQGLKVIMSVCKAARSLLQDRFYSDVSIVQLAKKARVARASLLLQFPRGWPDVLGILAGDEMNLDEAINAFEATKGLTQAQRLYSVLEGLLVRAEASGKLYSSIRAATFNFEVQNKAVYRINYEGCWEIVVYLLVGKLPSRRDGGIERRTLDLADGLLTLTLDLASGGDPWELTWEQRRVALRTYVEAAVAAVKPEKTVKKRR